MNIFSQPAWLNQFDYPHKNFEETPRQLFDTINANLKNILSDEPLVSIIISAWNEEENILKCIDSLSKTKTKRLVEIVVVNNNSTDSTQLILDNLNIRTYFQPIQGWGPARQLGQEKAKGKFILLGDADCFYPESWVDDMINALEMPDVVCVYGRYSFISNKEFPRWKLYLLETMKDAIAEIRHLKRPYLNAYGMSMGYIKELGVRIGFVMYKVRGEDGRLCLGLMDYGKITQLKLTRARVWTGTRTLQKDGNFGTMLRIRVVKEMKRIFTMISKYKPTNSET